MFLLFIGATNQSVYSKYEIITGATIGIIGVGIYQYNKDFFNEKTIRIYNTLIGYKKKKIKEIKKEEILKKESKGAINLKEEEKIGKENIDNESEKILDQEEKIKKFHDSIEEIKKFYNDNLKKDLGGYKLRNIKNIIEPVIKMFFNLDKKIIDLNELNKNENFQKNINNYETEFNKMKNNINIPENTRKNIYDFNNILCKIVDFKKLNINELFKEIKKEISLTPLEKKYKEIIKTFSSLNENGENFYNFSFDYKTIFKFEKNANNNFNYFFKNIAINLKEFYENNELASDGTKFYGGVAFKKQIETNNFNKEFILAYLNHVIENIINQNLENLKPEYGSELVKNIKEYVNEILKVIKEKNPDLYGSISNKIDLNIFNSEEKQIEEYKKKLGTFSEEIFSTLQNVNSQKNVTWMQYEKWDPVNYKIDPEKIKELFVNYNEFVNFTGDYRIDKEDTIINAYRKIMAFVYKSLNMIYNKSFSKEYIDNLINLNIRNNIINSPLNPFNKIFNIIKPKYGNDLLKNLNEYINIFKKLIKLMDKNFFKEHEEDINLYFKIENMSFTK